LVNAVFWFSGRNLNSVGIREESMSFSRLMLTIKKDEQSFGTAGNLRWGGNSQPHLSLSDTVLAVGECTVKPNSTIQ